MSNEKLSKSIDELIDQLFTAQLEELQSEESEELVEKSIDIAGDSTTKADEAASKAPKAQDDDKRGAGRPKQISDVPMVDQDGKRDGEYDEDISENAKESDQDEADQVKESNQLKAKGGKAAAKPPVAPFKKSISDEEYEQFQAFKAQQAESMKKAEESKQEELIKSIIEKTSAKYEQKLEQMQKALNESQTMIKAMANRPVSSKSITNVAALEKSMEASDEPKAFSKSQVLDAAEEMFAKGTLSADEVIELENTGFIFNPASRRALEAYVANKK